MKYLISYDLQTPGKDYNSLYNILKSAPGWAHYLESTWFISSNESLEFWHEKIKNVIDANDNFFIVDISDSGSDGWLPRNAWEWLNSHS